MVHGVQFRIRDYLKKNYPELTNVKEAENGCFQCPLCLLAARGPEELLNHYKYAHLDEKGNVTKTKKNKKSYASLAFIKASANGVLHCPKCPMTFKTRSSLGKHFSEVHREDNYECPVCHVIFGTMSTARFHISQLPAYTAMSSFQRRSN